MDGEGRKDGDGRGSWEVRRDRDGRASRKEGRGRDGRGSGRVKGVVMEGRIRRAEADGMEERVGRGKG